jgi:hypothetical protein
MQSPVKAVCLGFIAALAALLPAFKLFDWMFIAYWEWQHQGRPMKITLWADDRAFLFTLFLCAIVFYVAVRYLQRRLPLDRQIKRRTLVVGAVVAVVFVYVAVAAYLWMVVSRFSS